MTLELRVPSTLLDEVPMRYKARVVNALGTWEFNRHPRPA